VFEIPQIEIITEDVKKGFYRIENTAYHSSAGVSSTTVKKALNSYGNFVSPREAKDCFNFGSAFHCFVLEPALFSSLYVVAPVIPGHKNSNAYKAQYEAFVQQAHGKEIIGAEDYQTIVNMANILYGHPDFSTAGFQPEIMAVTRCKETGLLIKCKADQFSGFINDLKTTSASVIPHEFMNEVIKYGYHVSMAFYQDIVADIIGVAPTMKITAVEKRAPHDCAVFTLGDSLLEEGRKLYKAGLRRIKKWNDLGPADSLRADYRKYTLEANGRMRYNAEDILKFTGDV